MNDQARDKAVEKLVASRLREQPVSAGPVVNPGCLDASTLAAYVERALAPAERLASEAHLASCARCQEQVAHLVRLSEADEPVMAVASLGAAAGARPARPAKIDWFRWTWAAPALIAVVVAGLWYTGELPPPAQRSPEVSVKAPVPPPEPPQSLVNSPAPVESKPALVAPRQESEAAEGRLSKRDSLRALARKKAELRAANEFRAAAGGTQAMQAGRASAGAPATSASGPQTDEVMASPAAPGAEAATRAQSPSDARPGVPAAGAMALPSERARLKEGIARGPVATARDVEAKQGSTETANQSGVISPPPRVSQAFTESATDELAKAKNERQAQKTRKLAASGATSFASNQLVDISSQWRVGAHGLIQKFEDTWLAVASGVTANLTGIVFPTPSVGWVVGEAGTVLRSTDGGNTWQKITFNTGEDLIQVTATSDQSASVTTRSGKVFTTADGGKTWTQR